MAEWGENTRMKKERGIALITVLLILAFLFALTLAIVATGELSYRIAVSSARSHRNSYEAESQLTRTMWNVVYDINKYGGNRKLGFKDDLGSKEQEEEIRYLADGKPLITETEDKIITVVLQDAMRGFDFSGSITALKISEINKQVNLPADATEEERQPLQDFLDKLVDYTDLNDFHRDNGLEKEGYMEESGFDLPRNAPIEFAEEVLWIPGIEEALFAQRNTLQYDFGDKKFNFKVSDYLSAVPYRGKSYPRNVKPNFFSATDYQIMQLAQLEPSELIEVLKAREDWYKEGINLEESIPELYAKLSTVFSFSESKIYRIRVQVSNKDGSGMVNSETIIDIDKALPRYVQDTFSGFRFWRKVNF